MQMKINDNIKIIEKFLNQKSHHRNLYLHYYFHGHVDSNFE